jgi:hypothetical protein
MTDKLLTGVINRIGARLTSALDPIRPAPALDHLRHDP